MLFPSSWRSGTGSARRRPCARSAGGLTLDVCRRLSAVVVRTFSLAGALQRPCGRREREPLTIFALT